MKIPWAVKEAAIRSLEAGGKVDPADLIKAARKPSHPCHGDFTWDVDAAAEERWRDQARALIRTCSFEVQVEEVGQRVVNYVASGDDDSLFVSVPKLRGKNKIQALFLSEVAMLLGNASRVVGLATAKSGLIDVEILLPMEEIQRRIRAVKESLE